MGRARRLAVPLIAALALTAVDQATKAWIVRHFGLFEARAVLPDYLHIVHVRNTGVAFGMLANLDSRWVTPLLIAGTLCAVAAVIGYILYTPQRGPAPSALGLILGGAIGNLIDRARLGYVVDFLDFHWGHRHWPASNAADIGITVGVFLLVLDMMVWSKDPDAPRSS